MQVVLESLPLVFVQVITLIINDEVEHRSFGKGGRFIDSNPAILDHGTKHHVESVPDPDRNAKDTRGLAQRCGTTKASGFGDGNGNGNGSRQGQRLRRRSEFRAWPSPSSFPDPWRVGVSLAVAVASPFRWSRSIAASP